ncbi:hypothetical protein CERZMDRAFT_84863 [Cercospora zeae-maydis SCOH1-5]|uniref:Uncharacterized protein n=1 Tax=Cercospora zeae-maydis SCOH1-5 TaxID=717836 RepID=A0A6A6FEL2_9PEZI|nr:hypothetical protein CERZMDRAFT_84863 [Cercospora zeae-maydis SCOH1-5]
MTPFRAFSRRRLVWSSESLQAERGTPSGRNHATRARVEDERVGGGQDVPQAMRGCRLREQVRPMDVVVPDGGVTEPGEVECGGSRAQKEQGDGRPFFRRRCGAGRPLQVSAAQRWSGGGWSCRVVQRRLNADGGDGDGVNARRGPDGDERAWWSGASGGERVCGRGGRGGGRGGRGGGGGVVHAGRSTGLALVERERAGVHDTGRSDYYCRHHGLARPATEPRTPIVDTVAVVVADWSERGCTSLARLNAVPACDGMTRARAGSISHHHHHHHHRSSKVNLVVHRPRFITTEAFSHCTTTAALETLSSLCAVAGPTAVAAMAGPRVEAEASAGNEVITCVLHPSWPAKIVPRLSPSTWPRRKYCTVAASSSPPPPLPPPHLASPPSLRPARSMSPSSTRPGDGGFRVPVRNRAPPPPPPPLPETSSAKVQQHHLLQKIISLFFIIIIIILITPAPLHMLCKFRRVRWLRAPLLQKARQVPRYRHWAGVRAVDVHVFFRGPARALNIPMKRFDGEGW